MTEQEWDALFKEAISENFARIVRVWNKRDVKLAPHVFKKVKSAHHVAFLSGICWQRRR